MDLPTPLPEQPRKSAESSLPQDEELQKSRAAPLQVLPSLENKVAQPLSESTPLKLPTRDISVNVDAMPLNNFIHFALGEMLKLSFEVDATVSARQDPVTLHITRPVNPKRLLDMVEQALRAYDIFLAWSPEGLRVLPISKAGSTVPQIISEHAKNLLARGRSMVIIPLRYTTAGEALAFVRHFLPGGDINDVMINTRLNALVVIGMPDRINSFQQAIDLVDIPSFAHKKLIMIRPTYWQASDLAKSLTKLLKAQDIPVGNTESDPGVRFIVIEPINAIVIASAEASWVKLINQFIEQLDTAEAAGEETNSYVYFVKNSTAKGLGAVVSSILSGSSSSTSSTDQKTTPSGDTSSATTSSSPLTPAALTPVNPVTSATNSLPMAQGKGLRVVVDSERNALIFIGTARAYRTAYHLLQQLDREPRQILLEATVADISVDEENKLGIDWAYNPKSNTTETSSNVLGSYLGVATGAGLSYTFLNTASGLLAKINALATNKKAKILSSPRLLTKDNESASINVGQQIAVLNSQVGNTQSTTTAGTNVLLNYSYISTGVTLSFTPTILDDGKVSLKISQEVSSPGAGGGNTPPINTRKVQTVLIADSGQTVMIGGLLTHNESVDDNKVPWLSEIPWFGKLFSKLDRTDNVSNMIILITPHIVTSSAEAVYLTKEFQKQLNWDIPTVENSIIDKDKPIVEKVP